MIQHQLESRIFRILDDLSKMDKSSSEAAELFTFDESGKKIAIENGTLWGSSPWQDFEVRLHVSPAPEGRRNYLYLTTGREGQWDALNPQFLARLNGRAMQAFDVNHTRMPLDGDGKVTVELKGYCNIRELSISRPFVRAELCCVNTELEQLYYDMKVPYEAATLLKAGEREREVTLEILSRAVDLLDQRMPNSAAFDESVAAARNYLRENYYEKRRSCTPVAYADCIGHTHIDIAWLWDIEQTRHKAVRSFSTVCDLMDRYPDYKFMSSQPILYDFVKQDEPELYERIRQRVNEGRWEVEGGMWVEPDCNLSSGESLARQFLYGQRFFHEEFGKRSRILWLPDVFGYSAALPQIMRLCGVDYFMTTKISWNEFNVMPYDTFNWKGIDGTCVLTHFSPPRDYVSSNIGEGHHKHGNHYTTYTSILNPNEIAGGWKRFMQKGLDDHFLVLYGYGDGGGGPTDWMIEQARRMETPMPITPVVQQEFARPFFEKLEKRVGNNPDLPVWSGELYLEYHRGTYTSQGHNKRSNRKAELALRSAELRCVQAGSTPKQQLDEIWRDVLTLQFHDILPGSSIRKVYEDSDKMYAACFERLARILHDAEAKLGETAEDMISVCNDLDFVRDDVISFRTDSEPLSLVGESGERFPVQRLGDEYIAYVKNILPFAVSNFRLSETACGESAMHIDSTGFDTPFYRGRFDESMRIVNLFDKRSGRELCREGKALNRLVCYESRPHNYDAWELNIYYNRKKWEIDEVASVELLGCGPVAAGLRVTWNYMSSFITQDILFYADSPRIDFRTHADWHEQTYIVKAHFPLDVFHTDITCDIQYGNVRRPTCKNTSWDVARFEICAHKWVDISEPDYGVALLNDCKYGHSADDDELSLTLLKTATYPDEMADIGGHDFTYALLPHMGDWRQGNVVREAYMLNIPSEVLVEHKGLNTVPLLELEGEGAVIEAVKQAEDGRGTVVRLYECFGGRRTVTLKPGFACERAEIVNILEEEIAPAALIDGKLPLTLNPYQILTVRFI